MIPGPDMRNCSYIYKSHKTDLMKYLTFILLILLAACNSGKAPQEEEQWIKLFNGSDLDNWIIKFAGHPLNENFNNTFRVEDDMLVVRYDEYDSLRGEFGHIFYHKPFSRFRLRLEYRIVGEQVAGGPEWAYKNNGVMFHSQSAASMLTDQKFPVSLEAQLLGGHSEGERPTGNLCTPGTHVELNGGLHTPHCTNSRSQTYRGEEWINFELVVLGNEVAYHIINGDTVLTYTKPQIGGELPEDFPLLEGTLLESGYIALQAESHPFDFRNIELLDLSEK
jgi:hypothetical protein